MNVAPKDRRQLTQDAEARVALAVFKATERGGLQACYQPQRLQTPLFFQAFCPNRMHKFPSSRYCQYGKVYACFIAT